MSQSWDTIDAYGVQQLRQQLAWVLAQIVVVGAGFELQAPELQLSYYDIMVRNALGNLGASQEVTYRAMQRKGSYALSQRTRISSASSCSALRSCTW